jgi:hypothetical protein
MRRKGDVYHNAVMESFYGTLKRELVNLARYATRQEAKQAIFECIEVFYNRQRLHSTRGYRSPVDFEAGEKQVLATRHVRPLATKAEKYERWLLSAGLSIIEANCTTGSVGICLSSRRCPKRDVPSCGGGDSNRVRFVS